MKSVHEGKRIFALTVSDILEPEVLCKRISHIVEMSRSFSSLGMICVRNDSGSTENFEEAVLLTATLWPGEMILQSDDMSAISKSMLHTIDRQPLILCTDRSSLQVADVAASAFGTSLAVDCPNPESALDLLADVSCELSILFVPSTNMKECLEFTEHIRRLKHMCPELDGVPVAIRCWSGEYSIAVATVACVNDVSLVVFDDLDEVGCETIDLLMKSLQS